MKAKLTPLKEREIKRVYRKHKKVYFEFAVNEEREKRVLYDNKVVKQQEKMTQ